MGSRLLPAFGHLPGLIGKSPQPLDLGWIVDAPRLAEEVSPPLQQSCGVSGCCCGRGQAEPVRQHTGEDLVKFR